VSIMMFDVSVDWDSNNVHVTTVQLTLSFTARVDDAVS